jgi:hypothetical protein
MFNNLHLTAKIAFVCFVLGKFCFLPSVAYLFLGKMDLAYMSIYCYITFILISIVFAIIDIKSKRLSLNDLRNRISNSDEEQTIVVKVKNGKIIEFS